MAQVLDRVTAKSIFIIDAKKFGDGICFFFKVTRRKDSFPLHLLFVFLVNIQSYWIINRSTENSRVSKRLHGRQLRFRKNFFVFRRQATFIGMHLRM
jgi:hypothetical protein